MNEDYKNLYEQMEILVSIYQNEIVPGLNKVIKDLSQRRVGVVLCKDCKNRYIPFKCALYYGRVDGKDCFIGAEDGFGCTRGELENDEG